ncbi:DUF3800 domain-containing protein [Streptomyces antibioticus]|uniref:DUF3800 domain-containing protein n=1 Tax=Streptomyces antibioticus TaxID=1890 RepID=A0AAE6Y4R9_STRAT|nr:DUF3800 domain-containing protein [Streptomyces antibioticus]OOQ55316.1 hypothetical protein AFM16_04735 [Streptomyces antibioticus]QIT42955.1 DUF3800 domain-containing protein [Streptomyces antibioticus]
MTAAFPLAPAVYVDESANSGQNLLDPAQPVFTLAGVQLPDELAAHIVDELRTQLPPNLAEPKYTSLAKSSRGRKALAHAFGQLPEGSVRTYVVNKRFMIMTKLVDLLVEPLAHADGVNLYEGKESLGLADMLHTCGPVFGDPMAYDRLLQSFVHWIRQKATTDDLFAAVASFKTTVQHDDFVEWVELLEHCRGVADETAADVAAGRLKDALDPAVPSLYTLTIAFGSSLGRHFRLVHDDSKVISHNAALLRTIHMFPDPARPGKFNQQMPALEIQFADSTTHPQLQVADWAAGATRQWAQHLAGAGGDQFSRDLEAAARPWLVGGIWPPSATT